jgi:hypothetical protein
MMKVRMTGVAVAVVLLLALFSTMALAMPSEPTVTPVAKQLTVTLYGPTAITTSTVTSTAPGVLDGNGREVAKTTGWSNADVFVTVDCHLGGACNLVATVQVSADGTNWATADYDYESNTSTWNSQGITSTATSSTAIAQQSFARTLTADGTEYMRVPLSGEYMRVQLVATGITMTPTVKATYRN